MRGWEKIQERQSEVVRFLVNSYRKNRLVHAYILEVSESCLLPRILLKCYYANLMIKFVGLVVVAR